MNETTKEPEALVKKERAPIAANQRGVQFSSLEEMYRFATAVVNSGQFSKDINTPEVALIRLQAGMELGLSPIWSLTNIMVTNGRPAVWGDALLGLVQSQADCEDVIETFEGVGEELTAHCEVRRRGRIPTIRSFSVTDAKRARLWNKDGTWQTYPKRMLQMRARSWACRDAFADALRGIAVIEEMRDVEPRPPAKPTEKPALVLPDQVEETV